MLFEVLICYTGGWRYAQFLNISFLIVIVQSLLALSPVMMYLHFGADICSLKSFSILCFK